MQFDIRLFFENLSRKFIFHLNLTRIADTLHEDQYTFFVISRPVLRRIRNVLDKSCRENKNTSYGQQTFFFRKWCLLWDNVRRYCRAGQETDDKMAHSHCMLDVSGQKTEYVIIIAFPLTNAPQYYGIRTLPVLFITVEKSSCRCALQ